MVDNNLLISFCCTLKDRTRQFRKLVASLGEMENTGPIELIAVDYNSADPALAKCIKESPLKIQLINTTERNFNRSAGLNLAAKRSSAKPQDFLFFIDADMVVPKDFSQLIRDSVKPRVAWFPICYSLHRNKPRSIRGNSRKTAKHVNGWWRKSGNGMCGFRQADFYFVGGWSEAIGRTYGKEDGDLAKRTETKMRRTRCRCVGLFHLWHPMQRQHYRRKRRGRK